MENTNTNQKKAYINKVFVILSKEMEYIILLPSFQVFSDIL